jgi:hypothetical protein
LALQQQLSTNFKNLINAYLQNKKLVIAYQKSMLPNAALLELVLASGVRLHQFVGA